MRLQATAAEINSRIDPKYTRFGRKISEEGLRALWAAMAKGEASSKSWNADHDGKPAVESRAEEKLVGAMTTMLRVDSSNDGDTEGSEGKKKYGHEKRVKFGMDPKAKADEDTEMKG